MWSRRELHVRAGMGFTRVSDGNSEEPADTNTIQWDLYL